MTSVVFKPLCFSFAQSVLSIAFAFLIGFPAGFLIARREFFGRKFLSSLVVVSLCFPSLLFVLAFVLFYGQNGFLNAALRLFFGKNSPQFSRLYSMFGIALAHGFYNFPLVMRFCATAWENLDANEDDAARICGAREGKIFFEITLRRLLPSIFAASAMVFLYCFFSFVIPLTFSNGKTATLELAIYNELRRFNLKKAAIFALIQTFFAAFAAIFATYFEKKSNLQKSSNYLNYERKKIKKKSAKVFVAAFEIFIFIFFILPFFLLFAKGCTKNALSSLFSAQFLTSAQNTFFLSTICAFFAVLFASLFAFFARFQKSHLFSALPLFPLCISPAAISAFALILSRKSNFAILVFAETFFAIPIAFKQISLSLNSAPDEFFEATKIFSSSKMRLFRFCAFPLARESIVKAFCLSFAIVSADASLPILLSPPNFETLSLRIFRLAGAYRFDFACASSAVLLAMSFGFLGLSGAIRREKK